MCRLANLAAYFASLANWVIVEFVPKSDSQVQLLLKTRKDIFPGYSESGFEAEFGKWFSIEQSVPVPGSERTLYLLKRNKQLILSLNHRLKRPPHGRWCI